MEVINAVGRRKSAIARIYMNEGKGQITINKKDYKTYFTTPQLQSIVEQPFAVLDMTGNYDLKVNLDGGGTKGQAEALRLAIARAIVKMDPDKKPLLKQYDLLTRDPREVERKKPGQPKARKKFQFSKR